MNAPGAEGLELNACSRYAGAVRLNKFRIASGLVFCVIGTGLSSAQQQVAEPFTAEARWSQYVHRTYGPIRMFLLAADAATDHAFREPACWDSGAGSYGLRFTRAFQRRFVRTTAELGTGLLTGEDLRYPRSRSQSFRGRIWNAVRASVIARMPDGSERPAYTRFFAGEAADLSTAHWTGQPIRARWMFESLGWSALSQVQTNLLEEFNPDLRRIGLHLLRRFKAKSLSKNDSGPQINADQRR